MTEPGHELGFRLGAQGGVDDLAAHDEGDVGRGVVESVEVGDAAAPSGVGIEKSIDVSQVPVDAVGAFLDDRRD